MKLTDSQRAILSGAAKRYDGSILPLPKSLRLTKAAARLVLKGLLRHKLVAEEYAISDKETWRKDKDGRRFTLSITVVGLRVIGAKGPG